MNKLNIKTRPIASLRPYENNARTHSAKQIQQIAKSIEAFGFNNPVLIDADDNIIAGHGRVEAAKLIGLTEVPTILLEHLTKEQVRAFTIADNKIAENAGWDIEILAIELEGLLSAEFDFEIESIGFETAEADVLIQNHGTGVSNETDETPVEGPDRSRPAVSAHGDLWKLGDHLVLCGDALKIESYEALMGSELAQMVFADPPYNVPIDRNVSGKGKVTHEDFAMACGEMTENEFKQFLARAFGNMKIFSRPGSLHYICMDWRHLHAVLGAGRQVYDELKNLCVWNKTNAGMGSLYRSKHELVFVFKHGKASHINNVDLGRHGRNRTNVWDYAGANGFTESRDSDLAMHPTVKPVPLVADAILDASHRGGIILDPFGGSGSTLMAAEKTGRKARLMEIDPHFVDTIIRRFENETGKEAVLMNSGLPFQWLA